MITEEQMEFLVQNNYPSDFIAWHQKSQQLKATSIEQVIEESFNFYDLLLPNGYLVLLIDGGGNCYAYDKANKNIKLVNHDEVYASTRLLSEMYSENPEYSFWKKQDGTFNNPNNLDISEIFESDANDTYKKDSIYVKKSLKENITDTKFKKFAELVAYINQ
jgi:hypothetical protein